MRELHEQERSASDMHEWRKRKPPPPMAAAPMAAMAAALWLGGMSRIAFFHLESPPLSPLCSLEGV